jgi:predicted GNAT family N-acyltransferase
VKLFEDWLNGPVSGADNYFYVLLIDHDIVGCGGFGYEKNNNAVRFIWGLVHRKYHKKGLGKKLFEFRMAEIKRLYPDVPIRLDTTQHSYGFFQKYGFKVDKITENFYAPGFDRYDMTYME